MMNINMVLTNVQQRLRSKSWRTIFGSEGRRLSWFVGLCLNFRDPG